MRVAALVLAAGHGKRLGQGVPKAFVELRGKTLFERSIDALADARTVDCVQPVVPASELDHPAVLRIAAGPKLLPPVAGGFERQDSVAAGLAALPGEIDLVAVHDAARCLVTAAEIERVIQAAREGGAALLGVPVRDTIKRVRAARVVETPPRSECWAALTPQVFRTDLLARALEKARAEGLVGTDDAELVERLGVEVQMVEGAACNLKITLPMDLRMAEIWLDEIEGGER